MRHTSSQAAARAAAAVAPSAFAAQRFAWQRNNVALLRAPWCADTRRQTFATASVAVTEDNAPQYALVFAVTVPLHDRHSQHTGGRGDVRVVRRVTKQHMASAFERAVSSCLTATDDDTRFKQLQTRANGTRRDVDAAVQQWLLHGAAAPSRDEIATWLLARMLLVQTDDGETEWRLLICGEPGAELQLPMATSSNSSSKRMAAETCDDESDNESDDQPPAYCEPCRSASASALNSLLQSDDADSASHGTAREWCNDLLEWDEPEGDERAAIETLQPHDDLPSRPTSPNDPEPLAPMTTSKTKTTMQQQQRIDNMTERASSTRRRSLTSSHSTTLDTALTNKWTQDRRTFELELERSQTDVTRLRELQQRTAAVARVRKQRMLTAAQRKLRAADQQRNDAQCVTHLVADALEYHAIADTLAMTVRRSEIAATREQTRLAQTMRVALGRTERYVKGPVLGAGPLSQREIDLHSRSSRSVGSDKTNKAECVSRVYDLHGRRHPADAANDVVTDSVLGAAMHKIERVATRSDALKRFCAFDTDQSGAMSCLELVHALRASGAALTRDQARVLIAHVDPRGSGVVAYRELLWRFFHQRAFIKKWTQRRASAASVTHSDPKLLFYQYDRLGRGALALVDFELALRDIGVRVTEVELQLLRLQFGEKCDGSIDYHAFHAFVSSGGDSGDGNDGSASVLAAAQSRASSSQRKAAAPTVAAASTRLSSRKSSSRANALLKNGDDANDSSDDASVARIYNELRMLAETQAQIRASIRK